MVTWLDVGLLVVTSDAVGAIRHVPIAVLLCAIALAHLSIGNSHTSRNSLAIKHRRSGCGNPGPGANPRCYIGTAWQLGAYTAPILHALIQYYAQLSVLVQLACLRGSSPARTLRTPTRDSSSESAGGTTPRLVDRNIRRRRTAATSMGFHSLPTLASWPPLQKRLLLPSKFQAVARL